MQDVEAAISRAEHTVTTGRSAYDFKSIFVVKPDETILDLGSGASNLSKLGNVIQLDYAYHNLEDRPFDTSRAVRAIYQELPFPDETFDRVLTRWGNLTLNNEGATLTTAEALRVAKPDGSFEAYPIRSSRFNKQLVSDMVADGYDIELFKPLHTTRRQLLFINIGAIGLALATHIFKQPNQDAIGTEFSYGIAAGCGLLAAIYQYCGNMLKIHKTAKLNNPNQRSYVGSKLAGVLSFEARSDEALELEPPQRPFDWQIDAPELTKDRPFDWAIDAPEIV